MGISYETDTLVETPQELLVDPSYLEWDELPGHLDLPESDGTFVKNFQEHPQSLLLTDSFSPVLKEIRPLGDYCIGQDSGIYWKLTEPVLDGVLSPDWFCVLGVPCLLGGTFRRSYVLWKEKVRPLIAMEFVSGTGKEERNTTPQKGKFWIYEQGIQVPYYVIYEGFVGRVEVYHLEQKRYQKMVPNQRGHYPIVPLGIELGIWQGVYQNKHMPWLRGWDKNGNLLLTNEEKNEQANREIVQERLRVECERLEKEQERQRAEQERQRAEQERQKNEYLLARLREMGIDPDNL